MSPPQAAENGTGDKSDNAQASVGPTEDVILPTQPNRNGSENPLNSGQGHIEPNIDVSILNSEIYQIYRQAENPYDATKKIQAHNNCVLFEHEHDPFRIPEEEFKRMCKNTLSNLWNHEPGETKFDRLKKFINGTIKNEVLGRRGDEKSMRELFRYNFTKIQILNTNGYEYFYVANFKLGHHHLQLQHQNEFGLSKWYRAESHEAGKAQRLAQLNVLGITNETLDKLQLNHYLTKNATNIKWVDFAQRIISGNQDDECLIRGSPFGGHPGMFYLLVYESQIS